MHFTIDKALEILERTPATLAAMLQGLSPEWTSCNEGADSWSVFDVVGHLIHGEKTDWMPRTMQILSKNQDKQFRPFDRFAQFENSKGKHLEELLHEFKELRLANTRQLRELNISDAQLTLTGIHPAFGKISLSQLLSTWVVHDLNHIAQIARVMAKQYTTAVGPWTAYLKILR